MGKPFFSGWESWQKLVFILGCGIALTICLGGIKLAHTHVKLRKHSVIADRERKEQAIHREMSQRRRGPGVPRADEVPFGIRALERGVEVEGVWVSRNNTPEPSIRDNSSGSSIWDFMPQKSTVPDIEKQAQQPQDYECLAAPTGIRRVSDPVAAISRPASLSLSRPISAGNLAKSPVTRDGIPKSDPAKPSRSKHPPPSFAKYSGNPSLHQQSSSAKAFEGIEAVYRASTYPNLDVRHGGSSSESYTQSSSGSSSNGSGPISSAAPRLLGQESHIRPRHKSVDFELLNSHRQVQAAETGQLTPRAKKQTSSVDLQDHPPYGSEGLGCFSLQPIAKSSSTPSLTKNGPSPPKVAALPAAVRRSSLPDVTPFARFVQTAPALPLSTSLQPAVTGATKNHKTASACLSELPAREVIPSESISVQTASNSSEQATSGAVRPSFEKERRHSQVVRGHGTGFEILKPGSLPAAIPPASPPPEKTHAVPPVSLQNYVRSRSRSSSTGSIGRKLQKKPPLSMDPDNRRGRRRSCQ